MCKLYGLVLLGPCGFRTLRCFLVCVSCLCVWCDCGASRTAKRISLSEGEISRAHRHCGVRCLIVNNQENACKSSVELFSHPSCHTGDTHFAPCRVCPIHSLVVLKKGWSRASRADKRCSGSKRSNLCEWGGGVDVRHTQWRHASDIQAHTHTRTGTLSSHTEMRSTARGGTPGRTRGQGAADHLGNVSAYSGNASTPGQLAVTGVPSVLRGPKADKQLVLMQAKHAAQRTHIRTTSRPRPRLCTHPEPLAVF